MKIKPILLVLALLATFFAISVSAKTLKPVTTKKSTPKPAIVTRTPKPTVKAIPKSTVKTAPKVSIPSVTKIPDSTATPPPGWSPLPSGVPLYLP